METVAKTLLFVWAFCGWVQFVPPATVVLKKAVPPLGPAVALHWAFVWMLKRITQAVRMSVDVNLIISGFKSEVSVSTYYTLT
jgi:hypothetical protein